MQRPIEILLADDHEIFRNGFKLIFKKTPEIKLIGEAKDGKELIEMAHECKPDIIFMDIKMPVLDGIEATRQLQAGLPYIDIIALTMYEEEIQVLEMLKAGAKGYLLKNAHESEIITAIKAVYKGENYFCESTNEKVEKMLGDNDFDPAKMSIAALTEKQVTIIKMICQELSTKQIAAEMGLDTKTIDWYRAHILEQTGSKSMAGIIVFALRNKIFC